MDTNDIEIDWVALIGSWILAWGGLALGLHPIVAVSGTLYALYLWTSYRKRRDAQAEL
jgi:hypothetical protein